MVRPDRDNVTHPARHGKDTLRALFELCLRPVPLACGRAMNTQTLYERAGGEPGISKLVEDFYQRVLGDPLLAPFFAHVPMDTLRRMQVEFFSSALGGPLGYSGQPLAHVHQGRGITRDHLRRFTGHLLVTLEALKLSRQDVQRIYSRIALDADEVAVDEHSGGEAG